MFDEKDFDGAVKRFKKRRDVIPENRDAIERFLDYLKVKDLSVNRRLKYLRNLTTISRLLGKPFADADRQDFEKMLSVTANKYSKNTLKDFKVELRRFISWLHGCGPKDYHPSVAWIEGLKSYRKPISRDDLLTIEDVDKLVACSPRPVYKALWRLLFASGLRASEILSLRIKDFKEQNDGVYVLTVAGTKTANARRIVPVIDDKTIATVNDWIAVHPRKNEENAPLWTDLYNEQLEYPAMAKSLRKTVKKAGLNKNVTPHLFRHSRAHIWKNESGLTNEQVCLVGGWSRSSKVPETYSHSDDRDVLLAFSKMRSGPKEAETFNRISGKLLAKALENKKVRDAVLNEMQKHGELFKEWAHAGKRCRQNAHFF